MIYSARCSHEPTSCFDPLFQKWALHAQWRGYGARSPVYAVSFCELFLCGSCPKEKVDNRLIVTKDRATNYRYKKSINAFSFAKKGTKEKALQKENADFFALTPRGRPLLKKRSKTIAFGAVLTSRQIKI